MQTWRYIWPRRNDKNEFLISHGQIRLNGYVAVASFDDMERIGEMLVSYVKTMKSRGEPDVQP